jgi:biopolymer transport protein ExbD
MKLQNRAREELEISLTSLIDVVLVLLVFFMISTSFVSETEIHLRLPEAKADAPATTPESLEIMVTEKGAYLVNGHPLVNNEARTLRAACKSSWAIGVSCPCSSRPTRSRRIRPS